MRVKRSIKERKRLAIYTIQSEYQEGIPSIAHQDEAT